MTTTTPSATITLTRIRREIAEIEIRGTAPLVVHRWSDKARREMLGSQQGKKIPKQPKSPEGDFEASQYRADPDGWHGFPTMAFKSAMVKGGARMFAKSVKMTELRQLCTFLADGMDPAGTQLTRLAGADPVLREDMVRVGMGKADIRYRAEYRDWSALLRIEYVPSVIDLSSVVALVDAGGTNGVGEWRPEKSGSFGTYEVVGA